MTMFLAILVVLGACTAIASLDRHLGIISVPVSAISLGSKSLLGSLALQLGALPPINTNIVTLPSSPSIYAAMSHLAVAALTLVMLFALSPEMRAGVTTAVTRRASRLLRATSPTRIWRTLYHTARAAFFSLVVISALAFLPRGGTTATSSAAIAGANYGVNRYLLQHHDLTTISPTMSAQHLHDILTDYNTCKGDTPLFNLASSPASGMAVGDSGAAVQPPRTTMSLP